MYNRSGIFDYCVGDSVIYKLSGLYKVISLLFVLFYIIICDSVIDTLVISFYIFVMVIFSDISIGVYFNNIRVCKWGILFFVLVSLIVFRDVFVSIMCGVMVIDFIIYVSIYSMTTSFKDIVYGVELLLKPFFGVNVSKISMNVGLFSKFVTILYNEDIRVRNAMELRGVMYREMGVFDRVGYFISNISPVLRGSLYSINNIKTSMIIRNYGCFLRRSNYRLNKFGKTDTIMLGINVVVLILVIVY